MSLSPDRAPRALDFELLAEIAVGATARIELCRITAGARQGELVAVKRLHAYIAEDPQFLDMFRDEVWMTAALKHRHVVEVLGWGQDAEGLYLAVECVRGVSLARLMKTVFDTGEVFSERMVVFLGACICEGLAAAHTARSTEGELLHLVHRDLTPGNVLLGFGGEVKITDFGLAKAKSRLTKTLTGLLKGQPQFMSPEQVRSEPLDARSDIFALGVLLFELFAGRGPWNATNELDVMRAITERAPSDLRTLRPKIDRALADVVARCLEKRPEKRFQSAPELGARLEQWLAAHGYREDNQESLSRFVRRNAMRQMRWFERAVSGEFVEQAREERRADRARGGPAEPRDHTHEDESTEQPPPDDSDWGAEDGPTLIKKSASARAMIEALRGKGRGAGAVAPGAGRPSSKGAVRDPAAATGATSATGTAVPGERKSERGEDETRPVGRAAVTRALAKLTEGRPTGAVVPPATPSEADDTARRRAVTAAAGASRPGVIAPPDPEAPPVPSGRLPAAGTAASAASVAPATAPPAAARGPDPHAPPQGAAHGVGAEESQRVPARVGPGPSVLDTERSTAPLGAGSVGAAPAAPAPVAAEITAGRAGTAPTVPEGAGRLLVDAGQLLGAAADAAASARRAADAAQAAAEAVSVACEAVLLASRGERLAAVEKLAAAQAQIDALRRGEVPARPVRPEPASPALLPPADRAELRMRGLAAHPRAGWLLVAALGLGLLALLLALVK